MRRPRDTRFYTFAYRCNIVSTRVLNINLNINGSPVAEKICAALEISGNIGHS